MRDPAGYPIPRPAPVLVGRTIEQILLREELRIAAAGHGRLALISGEAGIGKTTLVRDLVGEAHARGFPVLSGACYDLTNTPPYGLWLDLFEGWERDGDLPPPAVFAGGQVAPVPTQTALVAEVCRFFDAVLTRGPALLVLEDLHWADPASLELLRGLVPRVRHWPVLVLATYRDDEVTRHDPFAAHLPALARHPEGVRLGLRRLDADALHTLVAARVPLSAPEAHRLVDYLDRHAQGNPFFTTEVLRALEEERLLAPVAGQWRFAAVEHALVPSLVQRVIDGRVARLGEETRGPLAIAAIIGHDVPLALWATVAGLGEDALLPLIARAVDAHLLETDRDGARVRFVHALTREALYEGVLAPQRRRVHLQVAEAILATPRPDPDLAAYHLQHAGDARAWEWLVKAGDRAYHAYAWLTAADRFSAARRLLDEVGTEARTRSRLACRIANLKRFSDPAGAIAVLDDTARATAATGDMAMMAEARWIRGVVLCYLDQFRSGIAEIGAAIAAIDACTQEPSRAAAAVEAWFSGAIPSETVTEAFAPVGQPTFWLDGSLCRFLASAGHVREAIERCERCLAALDATPDLGGAVRAASGIAFNGLGVALAALGQPQAAREAFARACERLDVESFAHHALIAVTRLIQVRDVELTYGAARPAARRRLAAEAEAALAQAGGALPPGLSPRLARLGCLLLDGYWNDADEILRDLPDPGNGYLRREVTAARATLAAARGEAERVWQRIDPLLPDGPATEPGDVNHQEGLFLQRLAADLCLDAGDLDRARRWLEAHDRWLAWSGSALGQADGHLAWARYHDAAGEAERARACVEQALARAADPAQPLVQLSAHRLLGQIETAAGNVAAAEIHLNAALDLARACESPFEQARTLLALATARVATGTIAEAVALLDHVRAICIPLGAAPTLAQVEALAARISAAVPPERVPAGLTEREMEVLRLLPRGLSNAEIGKALFISPRTVQSHLTHLYTKLGVEGRAEAVAYVVRHGLA